MKKAIKITEEIKTKNRRYRLGFVERNAVDSIVYEVIPNTFFVTEPCSGGYRSRVDLHEDDGWKEPVTPVEFDERIHSLTTLSEVNNSYVWSYENKTQEQIDAYDQAQLDADEHASKIEERRDDGYVYYYRIMSLIERAWRKGQIADAIANQANIYFDEALEPILRGNWQLSNTRLATPPATSNQAFLNVYNNVVAYVQNYVSQTYSKD